MTENNENKKIDVYKEHLLGFVVIKSKYIAKKGDATHLIHTQPITAAVECEEGFDGLFTVDLMPTDEVIGIIPAQSGSLAVYKSLEGHCGGDDIIGYEFPSVEHPNWIEMIVEMQSRFKKKV